VFTFIRNCFRRPALSSAAIVADPVIYREKPTVTAIPAESFADTWQAVLATGISKRMLLLILNQYPYDRQICSFAGATLLNRYLSELSIHELEMIFRAGNETVQTRAADCILLKATSKDELGQLVVSQNVHQYTVARRILDSKPNLTDVYRSMDVPGVAETAFALYQEYVLAGRVSREQVNHFCTFNVQFGKRLYAWIASEDVADRIPLHVHSNRDNGYQPSRFSLSSWRIIRERLTCFELARCMSDPRLAKVAYEEYKARIRVGAVPPEHVYGMCHHSRPHAYQLREWLEQESIEYDLTHEVKLMLWGMMKTSSPSFARVYVH
jgi:hypothetical protein